MDADHWARHSTLHNELNKPRYTHGIAMFDVSTKKDGDAARL